MHPVEAGGKLSVSLPEVAGAQVVSLGVGFTSFGAAFAKAPVHVVVRSGEQVALSVDKRVDSRWQVERARLGAGPVTLEIDTRDNRSAHVCVALRLLEGGA